MLEKSHYSVHIEENNAKSNTDVEQATRNNIQQVKYEGESWVKFDLPVGLLQSLQCGN